MPPYGGWAGGARSIAHRPTVHRPTAHPHRPTRRWAVHAPMGRAGKVGEVDAEQARARDEARIRSCSVLRAKWAAVQADQRVNFTEQAVRAGRVNTRLSAVQPPFPSLGPLHAGLRKQQEGALGHPRDRLGQWQTSVARRRCPLQVPARCCASANRGGERGGLAQAVST